MHIGHGPGHQPNLVHFMMLIPGHRDMGRSVSVGKPLLSDHDVGVKGPRAVYVNRAALSEEDRVAGKACVEVLSTLIWIQKGLLDEVIIL